MKTIEVEILGATPLLMHRFSEEDQAAVQSGTSHAVTRPSPEQAAERAAYRMDGPGSNLYIPARAILAAIRRASMLHKIGRRSAKAVIAASIFVSPEEIDLGTKKYFIDSQSVVIRATKGRVMRHRPRFDSWKVKFTLKYNDALVQDTDFLRRIVEDAGARIGILDFRPDSGGHYGTFAVTTWKLVK